VDNNCWRLPAATLDGMTIASHCLALLHERGPLTAEELGLACHEAGVTTSRNPTQAVNSALNWHQDGRVLLVGDRFRAVTELLEGRWLTFNASADDRTTVDPGLDLACLTRLVEREGLPLACGGIITAQRYYLRSWSGPDSWLPTAETVGLRLVGGIAELTAVVIDDAAEARGARLVELLTDGDPKRNYDQRERRELAGQRLLGLVAEHDDLLCDPVPPLSDLFPAPPEELRRNSWQAPPPFWPSLQIHLPPEIYARLSQSADATGDRLDEWLVGQLAWLAQAPLLAAVDRAVDRAIERALDRYDTTWDRSVLPFPRQRGDDMGA
jgi:hypothetical protein